MVRSEYSRRPRSSIYHFCLAKKEKIFENTRTLRSLTVRPEPRLFDNARVLELEWVLYQRRMSMKYKGYFTLVIMVSFCLIVTAALAQAQAPAGKTVVIGFTAFQTGKLNVEGMRQINGLNLWMEKANAAGGVKLADGSVVKFASKFYDDESNKGRVQELYTKLINDDKADFLVSPYSSGLTDAAAVIAQQNNKILLTAGAASDSTYKKGFTMVYQTYTPASRYLTGAVDILAKVDPKAKNIAIVHEKDKFSTDVVNDLKKYAEGKGYKVVLFEGYDSGIHGFRPLHQQDSERY